MAPEGSSRFKSRFSLLSLLPSRHPPLIISHPPLPPTQSVSRHPTVVSYSTVSPIHSEYPSPSTPRPSTPPRKSSPRRPPPLDLDKTRNMYPPSSVAVVVDPGTAKADPPILSLAPPVPPKKDKEKEVKGKRKKVVHDPFEVAEVEAGHRYPSWQGGRVDIKPGQVIPQGLIPSMAYSNEPSRRSLDDNYESVLHNVLLTPTYLGPSPPILPTPSPSPSPRYSVNHKRRTLVDRAADTLYNAARRSRHSRWIPGKSILRNGGDANRSLQTMRDREEQEMERFRKTVDPVRLTVSDRTPQYSRSYASSALPLRDMHGTYSRRSPGWIGKRESEAEYEAKRARVVSGDLGWRETRKREEKASKRQKIWKYSIAIIILCLAALTIGLCTSLLTKSSSSKTDSATDSASATTSETATATSTSSASSASATSTSQSLATCLDLFTSSAPSSPTSYPCSDCVPLLTSTTNDFSTSLVNGNSTGVGSALQFCALMDVYKETEGIGLSGDGWAKDASPCGGWSGVACDSRGRITGLTLQYPNVPDELPTTLSNIYALQALHLLGNSSVPTGTFPSALLSLPDFITLDLEYTALTGAISSVSFDVAKNLTTLLLVSNSELGTAVPDLSSNTNLLTLAVTGQNLTNANADKLPSSITYLDLSYNSLSGTVPSFSQLTSLETLYLEDNAYTTAPTSLPSTLETLSLTANSDLSGTMPSALCSSTILTSCDLRSTSLTASSLVARSDTNSTTSATTISASNSSASTSASASTTSVVVSSAAPGSSASASASTASCGVCLFT